MARFINRITNTEMWVADERIEEYKAAGHSLVADTPSVAIEPTVVVEPKKIATKATTKKATTKKR